jgi:hypothetical protein
MMEIDSEMRARGHVKVQNQGILQLDSRSKSNKRTKAATSVEFEESPQLL